MHLTDLHINAFGKFVDKHVGPFKPGLNIVFGQNEAGKSTIASFIQGVLTGWLTRNASKKIVNTYTNNNNRSGELIFSDGFSCDTENNHSNKSVKRDNNNVETIGNINLPDKENFEITHCINADKLWDMGCDDAAIANKFMSAETGTKVSPAEVSENIAQELKTFESRDKRFVEKSIVALDDKLNDYKDLESIEAEKIDQIYREAEVIPELTAKIKAQSRHINTISEEINYLENLKGQVQTWEAQGTQAQVTYAKPKKICGGIAIALLVISSVILLIGIFVENFSPELYLSSIAGMVIGLAITVILALIDRRNKNKNTEVTNKIDELLEGSGCKNSKDIEKKIKAKQKEREDTSQQLNTANEELYRIKSKFETTKEESPLKQYRIEISLLEDKKQKLLEEYFVCLLKNKLLDEATQAWKQDSQPKFYEDASKYFAIMTNNKWTKIFITDNKLYVAGQSVATPDILSTSTRQQLYLALRIAVLEKSNSQMPVLCDDILVNFDEERRKNTMQALAHLASKKQVIMFTCHKSVVEVAQETASNYNYISL